VPEEDAVSEDRLRDFVDADRGSPFDEATAQQAREDLADYHAKYLATARPFVDSDWSAAEEIFSQGEVPPERHEMLAHLQKMAQAHGVHASDSALPIAAAAFRLGGVSGFDEGWVHGAVYRRGRERRMTFVSLMLVLSSRYEAVIDETYLDACWDVLGGIESSPDEWWLTPGLVGDALRAMDTMPTVDDWRRLLAERSRRSEERGRDHSVSWSSSPTYAVKHRVEIGDRVGYVYEYPNGKAWARLENPDEKLGSFPDVEAARQAVLTSAKRSAR
jgi:hypothetical protein